MTDDIARLGLQIDTRAAVTAAADLDKLAKSAGPAAAGVNAVQVAAKAASTSLPGTAQAASAVSANLTNMQRAAATAATAGVAPLAKQAGLARHEMINLSRQFQDIGVSLASGQSPLLVAVQQGTQVADVFASSTGTVGGFVKQVASGLGSILSPARLVVGGIAAIGIAGAVAATQWTDAQREVQMSLTGIGRASGTTASDINRIASASASTFKLSIGQARDAATQFAATGKIATDNIQPAVESTYSLAKVLGVEIPEAASAMAKALADPARGADQLNERLGFLDDNSRELIRSLTSQNRLYEAQAVILKGVASATQNMPGVSGPTSAWTAIGNTAAKAWDATGFAIARAFGAGTGLEEKLAGAQQKLDGLLATAQRKGENGLVVTKGDTDKINDATRAVADLRAKVDQVTSASTMAKASLDSMVTGAAIRSITPDIDTRKSLQSLQLLVGGVQQAGQTVPAETSRIGSAFEAMNGRLDSSTRAARPDAINRLAEANRSLLGTQEKAVAASELQRKATDALSPSARSQIAYQQTLLQLSGEAGLQYTKETKEIIARNAAYQASGGRAGALAIEAQTIGLLGQTATATQQVQLVENQRQQAALAGVHISDTQAAKLRDLAREQALGITQIKASADSYNAEASAVGMSTGNAQAYLASQNAINDAKRRGVPLREDEIAAIKSEANALGAAAQNAENMRWGYESLVRGPLQTLRSEISNGAGFFDALKKAGLSALDSISTKLVDMAAQDLFGAAFGKKGGSGGLLSLLGFGGSSTAASGDVAGFTGGGSLSGGNNGMPVFLAHTGGIAGGSNLQGRTVDAGLFAGAPRFHTGGIVGDEVPIIAKKKEGIFTPEQMKNMAPAGGNVSVPIDIRIDATGADAAGLARVERELAKLRSELPARVHKAVLDGRSGRTL